MGMRYDSTSIARSSGSRESSQSRTSAGSALPRYRGARGHRRRGWRPARRHGRPL